ncbi:MAG: acetate/propionate family kinase [Roseiarcus sp.]
MSAGQAILVLNAGSSSLKFALYDVGSALTVTARGEVENLDSTPHFIARDSTGALLRETRDATADFAATLAALLKFVDNHLGDSRLCAVGHRIVHGGADHIAPEFVTPALLDALKALIPLDPLHLPHNLAPIRALAASRPGLAQVACFDTAFHHTMPIEASRFALPRALTTAGVRRYGFHGLSYEFIVEELKLRVPTLARGRVVAAHLGAGASLCALRNGVSIATTMSFSVLDGLVMSTRCGAIDPGVLLYLARQGKSFEEIEDLLYHHSGLLGVSGISGDMRALIGNDNAHAREALDLFSYRIAFEIAGLTGVLGGLEGLVFTAGIGERAPQIRADICDRLAWLGVRIDATANASNAMRIGAPGSNVDVRVIATDEEAMIARHTKGVVASTKPPP